MPESVYHNNTTCGESGNHNTAEFREKQYGPGTKFAEQGGDRGSKP